MRDPVVQNSKFIGIMICKEIFYFKNIWAKLHCRINDESKKNFKCIQK